MLRADVATRPITLNQIGINQVPIIIGIIVTTRSKCNNATMPKMEPATRKPRIFEFIDMIR